MESYSESPPQVKKKKYGPKKDFLLRLSTDSDSTSSLSGDKFTHPADRFPNSYNGHNQSTENHSEKGNNKFSKSFDNGLNHPARQQSLDEQKYSLIANNQSLRNPEYELNQSTTNSTYSNNQSVRKHSEQNNYLNANTGSHSGKRQLTDGQRKFATDDSDNRGKFKTMNSHVTKGQTSSSRKQSTDSRQEPAASISSLVHRSFSSGTDSSAGSKRTDRSNESISMMSLPDELRLSFSELEEGSLQLDDLDLEYCSPEAGGNTPTVTFDEEKTLEQDSDLHKLAAVISSTSEQQAEDKQITEMTKVSEEFMTKEGQSSSKEENSISIKSEDNNSANITWDDLVQWGVNAQQVSTVGSSGEVMKQKKTISPRRSSKNKHMENVSCQVCGDMAAGFYCGAFICEACKKFYMRAYKQDKLKYVCLREKKCIITKESRVQCQYCRFQKCVSLNMFIPKQGEGETNKETQMSDIPCRVCSAPSSGFHFGAITCEGCKGFFRRMAKEREPEKYQCNKKGNCEINMVTRNLCKACRYRSCKQAGMSVEGSRIGRQPNSVKHAISMELKQGKPEGGTDMVTKVKEEPVDESSVDFLTDNNKTDKFSFWDQNSDNSVSQTFNEDTSLHNCDIMDSTNILAKQTSVPSSMPDNVTWPTTNMDFTNSIKPPSPPTPNVGSSVLSPNKTQAYVGSNMPSPNKTQAYVGSNMPSPNKTQAYVGSNMPSPNKTQAYVGSNMPLPNKTQAYVGSNMPSPNKTQAYVGSNMLLPNKTQAYAGNYMYRQNNQQSLNGIQIPKQDRNEQMELQNQRQMPPPPQKQVVGHQRSQTSAQPINSLVFTPSPVTQFLSTTPHMDNKQNNSIDQQPRENKMNLKVPAPVNVNQNMHSSVPQQTMYSPTSTTPTRASPVDNKQSDQMNILGSFKTMTEFINKIIDAGKCLQLLNYRVFDTDVNPTTSMNVDDIKALFKSKYMDPKAGNLITSKVDMSVFSTRESTWNYMMTNFHHNTYITIRFAKLVPGFKTLSLNDQVKLIQSSIYPIELLNMSKVYDPSTRKYNYFTYTKEEENIMMEQFPMLRVFQEHFLHVGEMVTSFQFTDEEFALLSALLLFPAEVHGLENPKAVEALQNQISGALQAYEERTFPEGLTRYGILLVRVAELVQCLLQHNLAIGLLLTHNPTIKVPQLFHELIIESIKEGQKL